MLMNKSNTVIYTGVTSDLIKRIYEHKQKSAAGFTKKYHVDKLVYFETFGTIQQAIEREKQLKAGSRNKKIDAIQSMNPEFKDLYDSIL